MIDTEKITMSTGSDTFEAFKSSVKDAPISLLRDIVLYTSNRIVELERMNANLPPPNTDKLRELFTHVPNFLKTQGDLDVSSNFVMPSLIPKQSLV